MISTAPLSERLRAALSDKGMTQADLCRATKIPTGAMSQYCNGSLVPRQKRIKVIADALGVSVAWLMGFDIPDEVNLKNTASAISSGLFCEPPIDGDSAFGSPSDTLNGQETELLRVFRSLSIKGQTQLLSFAFELEAKGKEGRL